jgi:CHAT domain-containing protein
VKTFGEEKALKEVVLRVNSPRVLHLATHGFFESDEERGNPGRTATQQKEFEDPMLRSGLYFAGANRLLSGAPPSSGVTDGVLTAFEATGLKLQGTELVVLSACETGLGSNRAGEGVFGLRRALQQAGAESVLMSMWSVPDYETQELMSLFYEKWLSGLDKYQALNDAQIEERARVKKRWQGKDHPELWAAFVVVGQ